MTLGYIILVTSVGALVSVLIAAALTAHALARVVRHQVGLSAGLLLGTALLLVLPEAHESGIGSQRLFVTLLLGLFFFFLLEKAELYRHGHHHEGDDPQHQHRSGFDADQAGRGGWSVLIGNSIHNYCDGVIIATAFLADTQLGAMTALAVIAHEIPQGVGDYVVLLNAGFSRGRALLYNALSSLAAVAGGAAGYFVVGPWQVLFPYLLVIAASSFIYVAVADLLPRLQRRLPLAQTLAQIALVSAGPALAFLLQTLHVH